MSRYKLQISLVLLTLILVSGLLAPWIAPYDPNATAMKERLLGPCARHWLGTDSLGRDILSRVLYGGRASILTALAATVLSMAFGMLLGVIAGYFGGAADFTITVLPIFSRGCRAHA